MSKDGSFKPKIIPFLEATNTYEEHVEKMKLC